MRSGTLTGHNSIPTWSRTRTRALGVPCAIRYTIGTIIRPEPTTGILVHSQPCSNRYTTDTIHNRRAKHPDQELNLDRLVRSEA